MVNKWGDQGRLLGGGFIWSVMKGRDSHLKRNGRRASEQREPQAWYSEDRTSWLKDRSWAKGSRMLWSREKGVKSEIWTIPEHFLLLPLLLMIVWISKTLLYLLQTLFLRLSKLLLRRWLRDNSTHMDITRWSTPKSDWLYSLHPKMEKLYTVSKNKTGSWLWLRSWTIYCKIQT